MIKTRLVDDENGMRAVDVPHLIVDDEVKMCENQEAARRAFNIPKRVNKYTPHQGSRERFRRLARIYHSHPFDCLCKSCELMDAILKEKGIIE
jgi:hypothetical protein